MILLFLLLSLLSMLTLPWAQVQAVISSSDTTTIINMFSIYINENTTACCFPTPTPPLLLLPGLNSVPTFSVLYTAALFLPLLPGNQPPLPLPYCILFIVGFVGSFVHTWIVSINFPSTLYMKIARKSCFWPCVFQYPLYTFSYFSPWALWYYVETQSDDYNVRSQWV